MNQRSSSANTGIGRTSASSSGGGSSASSTGNATPLAQIDQEARQIGLKRITPVWTIDLQSPSAAAKRKRKQRQQEGQMGYQPVTVSVPIQAGDIIKAYAREVRNGVPPNQALQQIAKRACSDECARLVLLWQLAQTRKDWRGRIARQLLNRAARLLER